MSWKPEVDEIERRRALAAEQGGAEAVEKHRARGRLPVRERIEALVDLHSFRESGRITGVVDEEDASRFTPANVVVGSALIDGRPAVVCGDDFTIRGAAYSPASLKKGIYADELALRRRVPLVRLLEAGGASIAGAFSPSVPSNLISPGVGSSCRRIASANGRKLGGTWSSAMGSGSFGWGGIWA